MNGSAPSGDTNCNNGIRTVVVFLCDEAAQWINTDVTFYVDVNYDAKACAVSQHNPPSLPPSIMSKFAI